ECSWWMAEDVETCGAEHGTTMCRCLVHPPLRRVQPRLPPPYLLQRGQGVRLVGRFVLPVTLDPRKAQGEPARILRARLQVVESHLHHQLRPYVDGVAVARPLQL